jgi:methylenetetrahydrofolate reductase (NADPH)
MGKVTSGTMSADSRLERVLRSGRFAVTAELNPPDSADPQAVYERALVLASVCDAINATDASGAHVHMSSVGVCALLTRAGYEPVLQISCRDKNRIAIQGDLLGAAAMGVLNVLCLTGDGVQAGDQPEAKPVFDLDSITLLHTARILRDKGQFLSGRKLETPPRLFLGAAENPFAPPFDFRALRLAKKVEAGAEFIQTQFCFDVARLRQFMEAARDLGLHERVFLLVGVGPLRSAKSAEWMRAKVPGVMIPDEVIRRLRGVPENAQREEGRRLCLEIITQVREIPGVSGIHVMAYRQEELVAEIIEEAGLLPRRAQRERPRWKEMEKPLWEPLSPHPAGK